jgi:hypothetical protein
MILQCILQILHLNITELPNPSVNRTHRIHRFLFSSNYISFGVYELFGEFAFWKQ